MATSGRKARNEFREKMNILIDAQMRNEEAWRAESHEINKQIKAVAIAQVELARSQKLTDRALQAFIASQRKRQNGR